MNRQQPMICISGSFCSATAWYI